MFHPGEKAYTLTVVQHCGGGAYGEVYSCKDLTGKTLALKVVSKKRFGNAWQRELKGITNYRKVTEETTNLLNIFQVGEDEENFFYTMELADATSGMAEYVPDTLASRLANGPIPQSELPCVLRGILNGIVALHNAGFAHRDIKPENVLFVNGIPKLADLGLLSPLSGTMTQLAGTLDFLPPELRTGDNFPDTRKSRQRNDLYAFGKLIYCCVTGNGANAFPSLPAKLPLTIANKLFFRLALRLCNHDSVLRMTALPKIQYEFQEIERKLAYGETLGDKLHYGMTSTSLFLLTVGHRCISAIRRHPIASFVLLLVCAGGVLLLHQALAHIPDTETMKIAKTLQKQQQIARETTFENGNYTFYHVLYSVSIPNTQELIDREAIQQWRRNLVAASADMEKARNLPPDHPALLSVGFSQTLSNEETVNRLYGVITPKESKDGRLGNEYTIITLMVFPIGKTQLDAMTQEQKSAELIHQFGENIEALKLNEYRNPRLALDTILFVGELSPSSVVYSYIYPMEDHSLVLAARFPLEFWERDMPTFLALNESLVWRNQAP